MTAHQASAAVSMNAIALPANSNVRRPLLLLPPVLQKLSRAGMGRRNVQSIVKAALDPAAKNRICVIVIISVCCLSEQTTHFSRKIH